jgi:hypothetical protein
MAAFPGFSFGVSNVLESSTSKENFDVLVHAYKNFIAQ